MTVLASGVVLGSLPRDFSYARRGGPLSPQIKTKIFPPHRRKILCIPGVVLLPSKSFRLFRQG